MAMISQEEFENYAKDLIKKSGIYACHIKTVRYEGTRFIESSFKAEHLIIILQRDNKTDFAWVTSEADPSTYYYFQEVEAAMSGTGEGLGRFYGVGQDVSPPAAEDIRTVLHRLASSIGALKAFFSPHRDGEARAKIEAIIREWEDKLRS